MSAVIAGLRLALARLLAPRAALAIATAWLVAASIAVAERRLEPPGAATRALEGGVLGLAVPLLATWLVGRVLAGGALAPALDPWARFGASRRALAIGVAVATLAAAGIAGCVAGALGAGLAHARGAPPLAADVLASAWIGAAAGKSYAALALLGSTFGARGRGRWTLVAIDLVAGGSSGVLGALVPRGHVRNLLGGEPPLLLSQHASAAALSALVLVALGAAIGRTRA